jgi:hypothetical protein
MDNRQIVTIYKCGIRAFDWLIRPKKPASSAIQGFDRVLVSRVVCIIQIVTIYHLRALNSYIGSVLTRVNLPDHSYLTYNIQLINKSNGSSIYTQRSKYSAKIVIFQKISSLKWTHVILWLVRPRFI